MRKLAITCALWLILATLTYIGSAQAASEPRCLFDKNAKAFTGTTEEQTRCLLTYVGKWANLKPKKSFVPKELLSKVGTPVSSVTKKSFANYLKENNISPHDLGGSLANPVSTLQDGKTFAKYFVIHDTSQKQEGKQFPSDINEVSWGGNSLNRWKAFKYAHVFVNRVGESITVNDFQKAVFGTKLEKKDRKGRIGLFLHIENVQPRIADFSVSFSNDAIAPTPGFTLPQYKRIALLYIAASLRRGEWLIPAYHAVIDNGIPNGHDDPQNFDLNVWVNQLQKAIEDIMSSN